MSKNKKNDKIEIWTKKKLTKCYMGKEHVTYDCDNSHLIANLVDFPYDVPI